MEDLLRARFALAPISSDRDTWKSAIGNSLKSLSSRYDVDPCGPDRTFSIKTADVTVAGCIDQATGAICLFADVGLPSVDDQTSVYRAALQRNLVRGVQRVILGLHAESGRVVATSHVPVETGEERTVELEACLDDVLRSVAEMRSRFTFFSI